MAQTSFDESSLLLIFGGFCSHWRPESEESGCSTNCLAEVRMAVHEHLQDQVFQFRPDVAEGYPCYVLA
eukprot:1739976-Amphidinium_carterae.1